MQAPILDFGVVKFGSCKSLDCRIKNLDQQEQQVPLLVSFVFEPADTQKD